MVEEEGRREKEGRKRHACILVSVPIRTLTLMISFKLNYLLLVLSPNTVRLWVGAPTYEFRRHNSIHSSEERPQGVLLVI